jgi:serine/threonine protein kinase
MTEFGPYRILDTLGRGGMGVVYRALLPGTDRIVALKVLANAFNDLEQYARFKREIRLTQELKHPQLVEVLDSGVQSDSLFIVMELVEGEDLAKVLKRRGRLAAREGARIVGLTASGLAHLHSLNVLHRDVKPDNILLASDGRIKLADYGLLRNESGTPITSENALVGTLSYLSPEALQGEDPTPAADLWALGCVAYRLLTGRPPVELGDTPVGILSQMAGTPPIPHPSRGHPSEARRGPIAKRCCCPHGHRDFRAAGGRHARAGRAPA